MREHGGEEEVSVVKYGESECYVKARRENEHSERGRIREEERRRAG